jgi:stearoyl-CoA desaturase (delta-9 desaturase)
VAILTFGEGWHNNHHAHPVSSRHGLRWFEIDLNWYGIWALSKLGLAKNVYRLKLKDLTTTPEIQEDQIVPAAAQEFVSA